MDFPALDAHAHIDPAIPARELLSTRAVILAATRSIAEYESVVSRRDALTVWGVGTHPGVPKAIAEFDSGALRKHLARAALLSEVGLDRRSRVPIETQKKVLGSALAIHDETNCMASIHTAGCTTEAVDALAGHRCGTVILHWWRGSVADTQAAVDLGCYFSFNPRDAEQGSVLDLVPRDRVLTETDHPYGDTGMPESRPGGTAAVEARIDLDRAAARRLVWSNFRRLVESANVLELLPVKVAGLVLAAPSSD